MRYQVGCSFCDTITESAEPHLYDLPIDHPKRRWANLATCIECSNAYGPPAFLEEWDTVRLDRTSCHFCNTGNVMWVGTAEWANPKVLLQRCDELMNESDEAVNFPADLLKQVTRVTSVCRKCAQSKSETELYQVIEQEAEQATLE